MLETSCSKVRTEADGFFELKTTFTRMVSNIFETTRRRRSYEQRKLKRSFVDSIRFKITRNELAFK